MANDITILSCPQCGFPKIRDCGNGLYQCDDCGTHFDKSENIVLTNEEWFCSLPTEEKATFLAIQIRLGVEFYRTNDERYQNHAWWVKWLKEKYE